MAKPGRNDPCACGSGRKYKHCCLARDVATAGNPFQRVLDSGARAPDGLNALGLMALQAGRTVTAIALFMRAIESNPAESAFHCNLALAYRAAGRAAEAMASCERALELQPDYVPAMANLGLLHFDQGHASEAIEHLQRVAALQPESAQAHNNLGNVLRVQGRTLEAIMLYQKAIALQPDSPTFRFNAGRAHSDFGQIEEAADHFRAAIALHPAFAEAHNSLALMLMDLGRKDEAADALRAALALKPDFAEAHFNLHSVLLDARDVQLSIESLRKVLALRPANAEARLHLAILLEYAGERTAAAEQSRLAGPLSGDMQAIVDGWTHMKEAGGILPRLVGISNDAFRLGLQYARVTGLVLEFGVRFGVSIRQIAELANQQVHGFDSFEGLPEAWHGEPRGSYSTFGAMPLVPPNVILHKGWFEQTLPDFLRAHGAPVRFMNVDCDLYSATRTVLDTLAKRIVPGTVIVFDDFFGYEGWKQDEFRAFHEAAANHGWRHEYLGFGNCTRQVVVRIK